MTQPISTEQEPAADEDPNMISDDGGMYGEDESPASPDPEPNKPAEPEAPEPETPDPQPPAAKDAFKDDAPKDEPSDDIILPPGWDPNSKTSENFKNMTLAHRAELKKIQEERDALKAGIPEDFDKEQWQTIREEHSTLKKEREEIAAKLEETTQWRQRFDLENMPEFKAKYDATPAMEVAINHAKEMGISEAEVAKLSAATGIDRDRRLDALEVLAKEKAEDEGKPFSRRTFQKMEQALTKADEITQERESMLKDAGTAKEAFLQEVKKTQEHQKVLEHQQLAEQARIQRDGVLARMKSEYGALSVKGSEAITQAVQQEFEQNAVGPGEVYEGRIAAKLLPLYRDFGNKQAARIKALEKLVGDSVDPSDIGGDNGKVDTTGAQTDDGDGGLYGSDL